MNIGSIVKSLKGHDKNTFSIVISVVNSEFVLIADGKNRTLAHPKLKRIKHLKFIDNALVGEGISDNLIKEICNKY